MLFPGAPAPPFELPELDGTRHSLADALGRGPALVVFWKPDCATCHLAFPYLQRLAVAYPDGAWTILGVSQDSRERSSHFAKEYGLTFPVLIDRDGWVASQRYDPDATPTFFLITPEGSVEFVSVGFAKRDLNEISALIARAIANEPVLIAPDDDGKLPFKPG